MQSSSGGNGALYLMVAVVLALAFCFWHQTLFILRLIGGLILIDCRPLFIKYWPFH
jgi:hypothetical protein